MSEQHWVNTLCNARGDREARTHGRVRTELLQCTLGKVVDLSAGGMRIAGKGRLPVKAGQTCFIVLQTLRGELKVQTQVAWAKQTGFRRFQIGAQFVDLTDHQRTAVAEIARMSANSAVIARMEMS